MIEDFSYELCKQESCGFSVPWGGVIPRISHSKFASRRAAGSLFLGGDDPEVCRDTGLSESDRGLCTICVLVSDLYQLKRLQDRTILHVAQGCFFSSRDSNVAGRRYGA